MKPVCIRVHNAGKFYNIRRRMEDEAAAAQAAQEAFEALDSENNSLMSPCRSSIRSPGSGGSGRSGSSRKKNGVAGKKMKLEDMLAECSLGEPEEEFTGISCLLITWKSNPEVQQFKVSRSSNKLISINYHFPTGALLGGMRKSE